MKREKDIWTKEIKKYKSKNGKIMPEDLEKSPFSKMGGLGKAGKIFGIKELKDLLASN